MKHPKYPTLFSPLQVGNVVFKNRIFEAPATPHKLQMGQNYPTEDTIAYYAAKARGGTACVCFAGHNMDKHAKQLNSTYNVTLRDPLTFSRWQNLTQQIHFYGAKAALEFLAFFYHGYDTAGNYVTYSVDGTPGPDGSPRPALTKEAMEDIAEDYADCAEAALKVGFDSILIHGGHGLVLYRFMSPLFNKRTDEFGGSFENRCRFPMMVLDAIRKRVGKKLLIEYRISGSELADAVDFPNADKQLTPADIAEFLRMAGDRIDIAHISAGNMSIPGTEAIMHPTIFHKPAQNARFARQIKELGVPQAVLTLGAFQDPVLMEETLATGGADLIAMARGTIADPDMPRKAKCGKEDDIIPCIKCFNCLDFTREDSFACAVNPTVGRENQLQNLIPPVGEKKKVVIIGGGPAGMEAAIVASQRGHSVMLLEKADRLGGKLVFSELVSFKYDLANFLHYQIAQVKKAGVEVRLNTEATPDLIENLEADVVLAAVGANAFIPPIPGADGPNVMIAEACYQHIREIGQKIVLIGGGEVGCETALALAEMGKDVTIIEMLPELCPETFHLTRGVMLKKIAKLCTAYTSAKCSAITPEGVKFLDKDGNEQSILCDAVVMSSGMRPRQALAESFRLTAPDFTPIGDCVVAKNVRTAARMAYDAAVQI